MKYYSIKDIAKELNVSKQTVYRYIKKNCIKEVHTETVNGNTVFMYDNAVFIKVSEYLKTKNSATNEPHQKYTEPHQETVSDTLYDALLKQLEIKDKEIERLHQALAQEQAALEKAQMLNAMDKQKILELEDKMAAVDREQNKEELVEPDTPQAEPVKKKWWKKIF